MRPARGLASSLRHYASSQRRSIFVRGSTLLRFPTELSFGIYKNEDGFWWLHRREISDRTPADGMYSLRFCKTRDPSSTLHDFDGAVRGSWCLQIYFVFVGWRVCTEGGSNATGTILSRRRRGYPGFTPFASRRSIFFRFYAGSVLRVSCDTIFHFLCKFRRRSLQLQPHFGRKFIEIRVRLVLQ